MPEAFMDALLLESLYQRRRQLEGLAEERNPLLARRIFVLKLQSMVQFGIRYW